MRRHSTLLVAGTLTLTALAGCTDAGTSGSSSVTGTATGSGASGSDGVSGPGTYSDATVQRGLGQLDGLITKAMGATTIPGMATAVVYQGKVVYAKGFGVRQVGKSESVDPDTVFQLASVSKPLGATALGIAATQGKMSWDQPVQKGLPDFQLADPWVSSHVTVADMYSHRCGLPDHSGDVLEDLGYSQQEIFTRLSQAPLAPFRNSYAYSNYGLMSGGESAARSMGMTWEELVSTYLTKPLGMTSTSYTYADLQSRTDRAALHTKQAGVWTPNLGFDVDRQAPAGGASSSINDLAKWVTMLLKNGGAGSPIDAKNLL